jgi:hypothetical protein
LIDERNGVLAGLEADGNVAHWMIDNELMEIAVADDDVARTSAIDVAPLLRQFQQNRVDEQLFVSIRLR